MTRRVASAAIALCCSCAFAQTADSPAAVHVAVTARLPKPLARMGSFVQQGRLYIVGGIGPEVWSEELQSGVLLPDGTPSAWRTDALMPDRRTMLTNSVQLAGDKVYVVGRGTDAFTGQVLSDGRISGWQRTPAYSTAAVTNQGTCIWNNYLYVTGGRIENHTSSDTQVLRLDGNAPTGWVTTTPLPKPLWYQMSGAHNGRVYLWGGLNAAAGSLNADVYSAAVNETNGTLGEWRTEEAMPKPVYASAGMVVRGNLVAVGGRYDGGTASGDIWIAAVENDGRVTKWRTIATDIGPRMYHSAAVDERSGKLYVAGGLAGDGLKEPDRHAGVDTIAVLNLADLGLGGPAKPAVTETIAPAASKTMLTATSLAEARQLAATQSRNVLAFFHSKDVPASEQLLQTLRNSSELPAIASDYVFVTIETESADAEAFKQYGVYKVPAFVTLTPDGTALRRSQSVQDVAGLRDFLP